MPIGWQMFLLTYLRISVIHNDQLGLRIHHDLLGLALTPLVGLAQKMRQKGVVAALVHEKVVRRGRGGRDRGRGHEPQDSGQGRLSRPRETSHEDQQGFLCHGLLNGFEPVV